MTRTKICGFASVESMTFSINILEEWTYELCSLVKVDTTYEYDLPWLSKTILLSTGKRMRETY